MATIHKISSRSRNILVFTSHPFAALRMQAGLKALPNCHISFAFDRVEVFLLVRLELPDLLVLDYSIDGVDSLELAKTFKRICPETAIITLVAKDHPEARQHMSKSYTWRVLAKPVNHAELYRVALAALTSVT